MFFTVEEEDRGHREACCLEGWAEEAGESDGDRRECFPEQGVEEAEEEEESSVVSEQ